MDQKCLLNKNFRRTDNMLSYFLLIQYNTILTCTTYNDNEHITNIGTEHARAYFTLFNQIYYFSFGTSSPPKSSQVDVEDTNNTNFTIGLLIMLPLGKRMSTIRTKLLLSGFTSTIIPIGQHMTRSFSFLTITTSPI